MNPNWVGGSKNLYLGPISNFPGMIWEGREEKKLEKEKKTNMTSLIIKLVWVCKWQMGRIVISTYTDFLPILTPRKRKDGRLLRDEANGATTNTSDPVVRARGSTCVIPSDTPVDLHLLRRGRLLRSSRVF